MTADLKEADLRIANLIRVNLINANLIRANLAGANLTRANLHRTNFTGTILERVNLSRAELRRASLSGNNLHKVDLTGANLTRANLSGVNLTKANLKRATLIEVNTEKTILNYCQIYGLSVWDLKGLSQDQSNLVITKIDEPLITVDDLQVAQFIYLLLNNKNVRNVIDTLTSKTVLILGRFIQERKIVLDTIANELIKNNLSPVIFNFERSDNRDFTETIKTLAGLSLFVIADITNPKSSPLEVQATIPNYQIPFVTIIQEDEETVCYGW